jgi:hypothetical protein
MHGFLIFIKTHHLNPNTTFSTQLKLSEINLDICMHAYMSMLDVMNCVFIFGLHCLCRLCGGAELPL